ncbi:MAG: GNAT family N-acetyltransferase, partial [archaeon]|nr:GNAT family N-acetyltransferase [archaeon]
MIYYNDENDPANKYKIEITSEAYQGGIPTFVRQHPKAYVSKLSLVHRRIYTSQHIANFDKVFYDKITINYLNELVLLHRELFPIEYNRDHFKKFILSENYFSVGAFIIIDNTKYLVGCALGEICKDTKFRRYCPFTLYEKKWYDCCEKNEKCGYLSTLGVINEYRNLGVGKALVEKFLEIVKEHNCLAAFLHVIDYNQGAQKFYEKLGWNRIAEPHSNYYYINDTYFDAVVFYKIIMANMAYQTVDVSGVDTNIGQKGCCQSFYLKFRKLFFKEEEQK